MECQCQNSLLSLSNNGTVILCTHSTPDCRFVIHRNCTGIFETSVFINLVVYISTLFKPCLAQWEHIFVISLCLVLNMTFKIFPLFSVFFFTTPLMQDFFLQNFQWHCFHVADFSEVLCMNNSWSDEYSSKKCVMMELIFFK